MKTQLRTILTIALGAWAFAAANGASADAARPPASPASAGPMTLASQKPEGSGVEVRYRVEGGGVVGQLVSVTLTFSGVTDDKGAAVQFTADPQLTLVKGAQPAQLSAGRVGTLTVTLRPSAEGTAYLNVFTTQGAAISATSIPIRTGDASSSGRLPAGALKETPTGDRLIIAPVK